MDRQSNVVDVKWHIESLLQTNSNPKQKHQHMDVTVRYIHGGEHTQTQFQVKKQMLSKIVEEMESLHQQISELIQKE